MRHSVPKIKESLLEKNTHETNTIVAVATPLSSEGAIGIIRLSGFQALDFASSVFVAKKGGSLKDYPAQRMVYGHIVHAHKTYDEVMAVYFKAPYSYTTEDVVEIHCHGNAPALMQMNSLFISMGASPAEPGEFTKRAFIGGRIDLSQAEAVMDMVSAKTRQGFGVALNQLRGGLQREVEELSEKLTDLLARIEVSIDYPDEDLEQIEKTEIEQELKNCADRLLAFVNSFERGRLLREGISVAIVGVPNVGKSSLMNYLLRENRAIVTDVPGTTRDILREWVSIAGIPVHLIDTAGIRDTDDVVEKIGVERSKAIFNEADLVLVVLAANVDLSEDELEILNLANEKKSLVLINKVDLAKNIGAADIKAISQSLDVLEVSVIDKIGLDELEHKFLDLASGGKLQSKGGEFAINQRQLSAITRAKNSVEQATASLEIGMPLDLIEVDLISAYDALGEITGQSVSEDVINRIFEKFCLGK